MFRSWMSAVLLLSAVAAQAQIKFEDGTWAELLAKAKAQNKPIFVDAYTTWCGPCKEMALSVFPDAAVAKHYNQHFVNVKIDMEAGEGPDLEKAWQVVAYPTFLYFAPDGRELHRSVGSLSKDKFVQLAQDALNPDRQLSTLIQRYEQGRRDPATVTTLLGQLDNASQTLRKNAVADEFFLALPLEKWDSPEAKPLFDYILRVESKAFQHFVANRAFFDQKLSADSTTRRMVKAVSYSIENVQSDEQFDQIKQFVQQHLRTNREAELLVLMQEAYTREDNNTYITLLDEYLTSYVSNAVILYDLAAYYQEMQEAESNPDPSILTKALAWADKSQQLKPAGQTLWLQAKLLKDLGKTKEAVTKAKEAIVALQQQKEEASEAKKWLEELQKAAPAKK